MGGIPFVRVQCYSFPKGSFAREFSLDGERKFVRLHKACCRSLEEFYKTSQQALNALVLAELFPNDVGKRIALNFHLKAEMRAKQTYERQRLDLSDFIKARVEKERKTSRKRRRRKS
jgi:hypothetical protein